MTLDELASIDTVTHEMPLNNVASGQSVKVSFTSDHKAYLSNSNEVGVSAEDVEAALTEALKSCIG